MAFNPELLAGVPFLGWLSYLHISRPSKAVCKAKHEGLCEKIDNLHIDVREIRTLLVKHIDGE